ncbi:transcriptional regulator [Betaproteobacteria bacterium]|nr:transcriptional regulator [Betaproteobacteria bacterium]GHU43269.1 transcriptional regulator [Betaproteobacteria bacterium]
MDDALFSDLLASVCDMGRHARGEPVPGARETKIEAPDVKALREATHVSQTEFARLIGVSRRTLENWEQHRSNPSGPARALLKIVAANPKAGTSKNYQFLDFSEHK